MGYLNISDASITASSERNANHSAKRVRVDRYLDYACAWVPAHDERKPWVQFDMEQEVTVWGVFVKPRCDEPYTDQRVASLIVGVSDNRERWRDVSGVMRIIYSNRPNATVWFNEAARAQHWRIYLLTWPSHPALKADLIGLPIGKLVLFSFIQELEIMNRHHILDFVNFLFKMEPCILSKI